MIIEEPDFRLTQVDDNSPFFDLELLYIKNKGKSTEKEEFRVAAYGVPLDKALKRVVYFRANKKIDTTNLKNYISLLETEFNNLKKYINE